MNEEIWNPAIKSDYKKEISKSEAVDLKNEMRENKRRKEMGRDAERKSAS